MSHVFRKTELCSAEDDLGLHPVPANGGGAVSGMCRSVPDTPPSRAASTAVQLVFALAPLCDPRHLSDLSTTTKPDSFS